MHCWGVGGSVKARGHMAPTQAAHNTSAKAEVLQALQKGASAQCSRMPCLYVTVSLLTAHTSSTASLALKP